MPRTKSTEKRSARNGHEHTAKAKREAEHIEESERKRGMGAKKSKQIAWATVHKNMSRGKREK
ncbi:MAG: hypothetical protein ACYC7D_03080 [Nitrososphaerales archaeon]